jgi:hypothetical protein
MEVAKNIVISELETVQDDSYIRAIGHFRDPKAIPVLKKMIKNSESMVIKLVSAKVLYDWFGYEGYLTLLEEACRSSNEAINNYMHIVIVEFTEGFSVESQNYFRNLVK